MTRAPGQRGMTVIELMVAITILAVVVAAAFSVAYSIMNSYREHRRAIVVERSTRGAMAVLVDAVRNASPGVPDGDITDLVGCTTGWQGLHIDNRTDAPDALDIVYATGAVGEEVDSLPADPLGNDWTRTPAAATTLQAEFVQSSTQMVVADGSLLRPGDRVLVTDFDRGHLLEVQNVVQDGANWNLILTGAPDSLCGGTLPFNYPILSMVVRAEVARFFIATVEGVPMLFMDRTGPPDTDREVIAEGVEDLQIAVGIDTDRSGTVEEDGAAANDDEWVFNVAGDSNPLELPNAPYRAVRLTVTGRSLEEIGTGLDQVRPAAEDRAAASVQDPFRRRSLSTTVEIRNLQGSPQ